MLLIRYFEEKVEELFLQKLVHGTLHLYIGEEAVAVGALSCREEGDWIASNHRGHGHCIAAGGNLKKMMAELLGKETGFCRGRGGSMHIADVENRNLGATGIVGSGIPVAVGAALTQKLKKTGQIVFCFFGDGATNTGAFHEAVNMASIWNLPIVFICENNMYAISFSIKKAIKLEDIAIRAKGYGIPGVKVDGNDILAIRERIKEACGNARTGKGPTLIECETYRWKGHSKSDANLYRTKEEIEEWKKKDPIERFKQFLIKDKTATAEKLDELQKQAKSELEEAVEYAKNSPEPDPATIFEGLYS